MEYVSFGYGHGQIRMEHQLLFYLATAPYNQNECRNDKQEEHHISSLEMIFLQSTRVVTSTSSCWTVHMPS